MRSCETYIYLCEVKKKNCDFIVKVPARKINRTQQLKLSFRKTHFEEYFSKIEYVHDNSPFSLRDIPDIYPIVQLMWIQFYIRVLCYMITPLISQ